MKKLVFFIALCAFTFNLKAQTTFGVRAGINLASVTGDDTDDLESLTGFQIGAVAKIAVSEKLSVQPELNFSTQGAKYTMSEGYDGKYKLNYINIPVMAEIEVADGLNLEIGPQIGFLSSAKDEYESSGDSGEEDIKDFIKGTDFALNFGANYNMESGLAVGARYSLGLGDINDFGEGSKLNNSVLAFYIAFFFL